MQLLKNLSITKKLMLLVLTAVALALLLSHTAFIISDIRIARDSVVRQLSALAVVLGSNTEAALKFDDSDSAQGVLSSLRRQPMVEAACIYDADGKVFASFSADGAPAAFPTAPAIGYRFGASGHLEVAEKIVANGDFLGVIYFHANLSSVRLQVIEQLWIAAAVMLASFIAAFLLASRLQGAISGPILALAETAQRVSVEEDYSIRVEKIGNDELGTLFDEFNHMLQRVESNKHALQQAHNELEHRVAERTQQLLDANRELSKEVVERRAAEKKLEDVHQELLTSARRAGMAEIATGVLHNVGNVLNSVNVSAITITDRLRSSKRSQLDSLVTLFDSHRDDLGDFVSDDKVGKQIPAFLKLLTDQLRAEEEALQDEARSLVANVEHIKTIVSTQQSYAGVSGVIQLTDVNALLDDAVRLNSSSFERHSIEVVRDYAELPQLLLDRQRLMQIMINLVKNAKESLMEQLEAHRRLTLRTHGENDRLIIQVIDTGVGIKADNLTRIFSHGFTTKQSGHGFGLHSCANSAAQMNGSLSAQSDGHTAGATFTLNLPLMPQTVCV